MEDPPTAPRPLLPRTPGNAAAVTGVGAMVAASLGWIMTELVDLERGQAALSSEVAHGIRDVSDMREELRSLRRVVSGRGEQ